MIDGGILAIRFLPCYVAVEVTLLLFLGVDATDGVAFAFHGQSGSRQAVIDDGRRHVLQILHVYRGGFGAAGYQRGVFVEKSNLEIRK